MRALIVGVGGLGCPAALALAQAKIERLTLVDPDVVELSNLHRQVLYTDRDLGLPKVDAARAALLAQFPSVHIDARRERVDAGNAEAFFRANDVVLDGTDGAQLKFTLSDAAMRAGVRLIHGAALRVEGRAMEIRRGGPCLRCVFERAPQEGLTCAQAGVLGPVAGVVGALMASLALSSRESPGHSTLHVLDGWKLRWRALAVSVRDDCMHDEHNPDEVETESAGMRLIEPTLRGIEAP